MQSSAPATLPRLSQGLSGRRSRRALGKDKPRRATSGSATHFFKRCFTEEHWLQRAVGEKFRPCSCTQLRRCPAPPINALPKNRRKWVSPDERCIAGGLGVGRSDARGARTKERKKKKEEASIKVTTRSRRSRLAAANKSRTAAAAPRETPGKR